MKEKKKEKWGGFQRSHDRWEGRRGRGGEGRGGGGKGEGGGDLSPLGPLALGLLALGSPCPSSTSLKNSKA